MSNINEKISFQMNIPNAATLSEFTNTKVSSCYINILNQINFQKTARSCRSIISAYEFENCSFDKGILRIKIYL